MARISWILSPPSLKEETFLSLSTTSSSLSRILLFPFPGLSLRGVRDSEARKFVDNIAFADFLLLGAYS